MTLKLNVCGRKMCMWCVSAIDESQCVIVSVSGFFEQKSLKNSNSWLKRMFKSRTEGSVVFKCTVRLLEELDVLECEFQVWKHVLKQSEQHDRLHANMISVARISMNVFLCFESQIIDLLWHRFFFPMRVVNENRLWLFSLLSRVVAQANNTITQSAQFWRIYFSSFSSYHLTFDVIKHAHVIWTGIHVTHVL